MSTRIQQAKETFDRDGFALVEGFLDPAEAEEVNRQINRYKTEVYPDIPSELGFYEDKDDPESLMRLQEMHLHDAYFEDFFRQDRFVDLGELLLDETIVEMNMQWFNKPPSGNETPPHQDGFYFMLEPNHALTLWLSLDDVSEENGCVRYLPG